MKHKEITVACAAELKDGEMKQVAVDGVNILLARVNGKYHAVGATCPHYGAPLAEGAGGERIICPWHHACFNVTTGDLEEPPALDALPRYEVRVENENIIVRLPEDAGPQDAADDETRHGGRRAPVRHSRRRGGGLRGGADSARGWIQGSRRDGHARKPPTLRPPESEQGLLERSRRTGVDAAPPG